MGPSVINRNQIGAVLRDFLAGTITTTQVATWADSVEAREDIDYEPGHERHIASLLFELASPEINGTLTSERAESMLKELDGAL